MERDASDPWEKIGYHKALAGFWTKVTCALLVTWAVPRRFGFVGSVLVLEMGHLPVTVVTGAATYAFLSRKVVRVRVPWAQVLVGLAVPSAATWAAMAAVKAFVFDPLNARLGFFVALVPSAALLFACLMCAYFPPAGLLGGWDHLSLDEFGKAADMSGPSRIFARPLYRAVAAACRRSRLHNRFQLPTEGVLRDAEDLLAVKLANREDFKRRSSTGT
ncbi:MAG: hypothetical protein Kow0069_26260 [Promethearchaeota archaeon]